MKPETPELEPEHPSQGPRSIPANTLAAVASQVGGKALGLAVIVLLARNFPVETYGRFAFAFTLAAFFAPLFELGADAYVTRLVALAPARARELLGALLTLKLVLWGIVASLALALGIGLGYPRPTLELLVVALVAAGVTAQAASFGTIFRARRRLDVEAGMNLAGRVGTLGFTIAALAAAGGILAVGSAQVAGAVAALLVSWVLGVRYGAQPRFAGAWRSWKELARGGIPFAATALLVMVYFRIDTLMLSHMRGERSVGFYNANVNLVFAAMVLSQGLVMAVFPVMARAGGHANERARHVMRRGFSLSLAASLPIAIGTALFARPLLILLYGPSYAEGALSLALLMATLPVLFLTNLVGHALGALGSQTLVLAVAAVNAAVNVTLNLWLIPRFGYDGASVATLITELIGATVFAVVLRRHRLAWVDGRGMATVVAVNAALVLVLLALRSQHVLVVMAGGAVFYGAALFLLRLIRREDLAGLVAPLRQAGP